MYCKVRHASAACLVAQETVVWLLFFVLSFISKAIMALIEKKITAAFITPTRQCPARVGTGVLPPWHVRSVTAPPPGRSKRARDSQAN